MFNLTKSGAAVFEAVTVAELKAHCRIAHTADDMYLDTLRVAAREQVEKDLNLAVAGQSYLLHTEEGFVEALPVPIQPVQSVTNVAYTDSSDAPQTLSSLLYSLKAHRDPPEIEFSSTPVAADVTVTLLAGFATANTVPALIKHAVMFLAAHWYENREQVVVGAPGASLPLGYERIIQKLRVSRFR